jgi:hypothetical protein
MRKFLVWQIVKIKGSERPSDADIVFLADSGRWEVSEQENEDMKV